MYKFKKYSIIFFLIFLFGAVTANALQINAATSHSPVNTLINESNFIIIADTVDNVMCVFKDGNLIKTYAIASGKFSTPSPIGTWKITNKGLWNEGFGGSWMGLNVPWGTYGIHGTKYPASIGYNASHGCIRMKNKDAAELYNIIPAGTTVLISGGPYGNFGKSLRILNPGMIGSDVYEIQKILKSKGYYKGNPNGIYSEFMKAAVKKFQKDNKIAITGIINKNFYEKLGVHLWE